jgi:hypothetical protein
MHPTIQVLLFNLLESRDEYQMQVFWWAFSLGHAGELVYPCIKGKKKSISEK